MKTRYYVAAGGVVVRDGQILVLHKHLQNEYVLPKGHVEPGETLEQAARRETQEETGYAHLRVLANLGTLQARFIYNERWTVRDETYFLMLLLDETRVEPTDYDDARHDAETFRRVWVPQEQAARLLTFEPAKTFVARAVTWLQANPLSSPP
jgi:8-oxo-dGTP pyrophosphatase MutT (NUDIX family)